jgi:hypothetical protein
VEPYSQVSFWEEKHMPCGFRGSELWRALVFAESDEDESSDEDKSDEDESSGDESSEEENISENEGEVMKQPSSFKNNDVSSFGG